MELLKLSKFKLQLRALTSEVQELREKERFVNEQVNLLTQRQKQAEDDFSKRVKGLEEELSMSNEVRHKLERKVDELQSDNFLLEKKQKELKGTIHNLLSSQEGFINAYQESTCEMKRTIKLKDRKLAILSEKLNSQLLLFDSIEKEAICIKQVVDNVQQLVSEKENIVVGLKNKLDNVCMFEGVFVGKIQNLEGKLKEHQCELQSKDRVISELEAQLEATKVTNYQPQIEELQRTISLKDMTIQNLVFEKEALHFEVRSLGIALKKIQDAVTTMTEEDKRVFTSITDGQEGFAVPRNKSTDRIENSMMHHTENPPYKVIERDADENTVSPSDRGHNSVINLVQENKTYASCVSESACSVPESDANCIPAAEFEAESGAQGQHLDSESSTTQAENRECPGLTLHHVGK